jgi:hypothetical protein
MFEMIIYKLAVTARRANLNIGAFKFLHVCGELDDVTAVLQTRQLILQRNITSARQRAHDTFERN